MEDVNIASGSKTVMTKAEFDEEVDYIWEDLLESAIWEFAFDVHRAIKLDYLFLDPLLDPDQDSEIDEEDGSDQKKQKSEPCIVLCPGCKKFFTPTGMGGHLPKCLKIGGRTSSREASRKISAGMDENDSETDSSSSSSSGRRRSKKTQGKKVQKSKTRGNSLKYFPENHEDFEKLSYEDKNAFFKEKCGVITRANKRCLNSDKCTQHSSADRKLIRLSHLSRWCFDEASCSSQIDVDIADKDSSGNSFT